jgi:hypothetical protein
MELLFYLSGIFNTSVYRYVHIHQDTILLGVSLPHTVRKYLGLPSTSRLALDQLSLSLPSIYH